MLKAKLVATAILAGPFAATIALAQPPTRHHSVTISATIVEQGKNGDSDGHTIRTVDNASILKGAIQFQGVPVKASQLDIVEDDDSGEVEIVYRASPNNLFYLIGDAFDATETTSFATSEPTGFTQYRIYGKYNLTFPVEGRPAIVGIEFTNHLSSGSEFKTGTATFRGGTSQNATFQFVVSGHMVTGPRSYVFIDGGAE